MKYQKPSKRGGQAENTRNLIILETRELHPLKHSLRGYNPTFSSTIRANGLPFITVLFYMMQTSLVEPGAAPSGPLASARIVAAGLGTSGPGLTAPGAYVFLSRGVAGTATARGMALDCLLLHGTTARCH